MADLDITTELHRVRQVWRHIINRCSSPKHPKWARYGGRGIRVCSKLRTFRGFISLVGLRPSPKHQIDRKDNNGHYSCGKCDECLSNGWTMNVRWITCLENNRNKSNNVTVTYEGKTATLSEWAEIIGIGSATLYARAAAGCSAADILRKTWPRIKPKSRKK